MFISALELFTIGIGPSSSHTVGPTVAARDFRKRLRGEGLTNPAGAPLRVRCTLRGSLAFTGKGHATDRAIALGLHGYVPLDLAEQNVDAIIESIWAQESITTRDGRQLLFSPETDILYDLGPALPEHPNGMVFELLGPAGTVRLSETYFSIGGGFIDTMTEIHKLDAPLKTPMEVTWPYDFDSARAMLQMSEDSGFSIAELKRANELAFYSRDELHQGLDTIWQAMQKCVENGLAAEGILPGGLELARRAKPLYRQLKEDPDSVTLNEWLCAYALAVTEENAAGHMVVTAPTNGAAGVIPAILYHLVHHEGGSNEQVREFLLTASAIGGIIKIRSSISGAEVGCQGEVGSAAAMAAAGLCAVKGGSPQQIENAAEIALEHHLGLTCDPVEGLVQVPCIERNGFGAIKAHAAASLALRESGRHFMPLDSCIAAMKQIGIEMSEKYKETSLGGLAVSLTEC